MGSELVVGLILVVAGSIFTLNNTSVAKAVFRLYRKLYTEKNLRIIFGLLGLFMIMMGIAVAFFS